MANLDDISSMKAQLAHHDSSIDEFGRRMHNVEKSVQSLQGEMHHGFTEISKGLSDFKSEMKTTVAGIEGSKGPGIGKIMGIVAVGGGILSMAAAAITVLVLSFMTPITTKLSTTSDYHEAFIDRLQAERDDDLKEYRRQQRDDVSDRLGKIEDKIGWLARVDPTPGTKARK